MKYRGQILSAAIALALVSHTLAAQVRTNATELAALIPPPPRAAEKSDIVNLIGVLNDLEIKSKTLIGESVDVREAATQNARKFRSRWRKMDDRFYSDYERDVAPLLRQFEALRGKKGEEEEQAKALYKELTIASNTLCEKYYFGQNALCPKLITDYSDYIRNVYLPEILNSGSPNAESLAASAILDLIQTYKQAYQLILDKDLFYR